jgi:N-acetylneuraminate synthase
MTRNPVTVRIGDRVVGDGQPVYTIAEIGINHNGDLQIAKRLIDAAVSAGADAVKFQKRTPEVCTPRDQWDVRRETPWGNMTYIDYRHRVEFARDDYANIDAYCRAVGIAWFASCWDEPSVDFISDFAPPAFKVASASVTDHALIEHTAAQGVSVILSTGMSTLEQIDSAFEFLHEGSALLTHTTSTYPCPVDELNLRVMMTLRDRYSVPVGYSGHETGLSTTVAAVALGACVIERHITLDRSMWGSDQAASVEPDGFKRLMRDIRAVERALGDGKKVVYESEFGPMRKLRRKSSD